MERVIESSGAKRFIASFVMLAMMLGTVPITLREAKAAPYPGDVLTITYGITGAQESVALDVKVNAALGGYTGESIKKLIVVSNNAYTNNIANSTTHTELLPNCVEIDFTSYTAPSTIAASSYNNGICRVAPNVETIKWNPATAITNYTFNNLSKLNTLAVNTTGTVTPGVIDLRGFNNTTAWPTYLFANNVDSGSGTLNNVILPTEKSALALTRDMFTGQRQLSRLGYGDLPEGNVIDLSGQTGTTAFVRIFDNCSGIESVLLPNSKKGVALIGYMFYNCSSLTRLAYALDGQPGKGLPVDEVIDLSKMTNTANWNTYVFSGCSSLNNVILPFARRNLVTSNYLFAGCDSLTRLGYDTVQDAADGLPTDEVLDFTGNTLAAPITVVSFDNAQSGAKVRIDTTRTSGQQTRLASMVSGTSTVRYEQAPFDMDHYEDSEALFPLRSFYVPEASSAPVDALQLLPIGSGAITYTKTGGTATSTFEAATREIKVSTTGTVEITVKKERDDVYQEAVLIYTLTVTGQVEFSVDNEQGGTTLLGGNNEFRFDVGKTYDIDVSLRGLADVYSIVLPLNFDKNKLEIQGVTFNGTNMEDYEVGQFNTNAADKVYVADSNAWNNETNAGTKDGVAAAQAEGKLVLYALYEGSDAPGAAGTNVLTAEKAWTITVKAISPTKFITPSYSSSTFGTSSNGEVLKIAPKTGTGAFTTSQFKYGVYVTAGDEADETGVVPFYTVLAPMNGIYIVAPAEVLIKTYAVPEGGNAENFDTDAANQYTPVDVYGNGELVRVVSANAPTIKLTANVDWERDRAEIPEVPAVADTMKPNPDYSGDAGQDNDPEGDPEYIVDVPGTPLQPAIPARDILSLVKDGVQPNPDTYKWKIEAMDGGVGTLPTIDENTGVVTNPGGTDAYVGLVKVTSTADYDNNFGEESDEDNPFDTMLILFINKTKINGVVKLAKKARTDVDFFDYETRDDFDAGIDVTLQGKLTAKGATDLTGTEGDWKNVELNTYGQLVKSQALTIDDGSFSFEIPAGLLLFDDDYFSEYKLVITREATPTVPTQTANPDYDGPPGQDDDSQGRPEFIAGTPKQLREEGYLRLDVDLKTDSAVYGTIDLVELNGDEALWLFPGAYSTPDAGIVVGDYNEIKAKLGLDTGETDYNTKYDINEYTGVDGGDLAAVRAGVGKIITDNKYNYKDGVTGRITIIMPSSTSI
jgi:hypothetical protein